MLEQPDEFARAAVGNRGGALVHPGQRVLIGHKAVADVPFDRRQAVRARQQGETLPFRAHFRSVNQSFTMAC